MNHYRANIVSRVNAISKRLDVFLMLLQIVKVNTKVYPCILIFWFISWTSMTFFTVFPSWDSIFKHLHTMSTPEKFSGWNTQFMAWVVHPLGHVGSMYSYLLKYQQKSSKYIHYLTFKINLRSTSHLNYSICLVGLSRYKSNPCNTNNKIMTI
jgi:type II secretory pathway component PulF